METYQDFWNKGDYDNSLGIMDTLDLVRVDAQGISTRNGVTWYMLCRSPHSNVFYVKRIKELEIGDGHMTTKTDTRKVPKEYQAGLVAEFECEGTKGVSKQKSR